MIDTSLTLILTQESLVSEHVEIVIGDVIGEETRNYERLGTTRDYGQQGGKIYTSRIFCIYVSL